MTDVFAAIVCPACGNAPARRAINLETGLDGLPMPGDLAVCGACGEILCTLPTVTPRFRVATPAEIAGIPYEQRRSLLGLLRHRRA